MKVPYEETKLYRIRHSTAHVLAQAVIEIFPDAKVAIGPPIEDGFYYDFELPRNLVPEDLEDIERRMRRIILKNHSFDRKEVSYDEALKLFKNQKYKLEIVEDIVKRGADEYGEVNSEKKNEALSIYTSDTFVDLCRGPHVATTSEINPKAFKLIKTSGAYWRGDSKKQMLQRIYGTAWLEEDELKAYLNKIEQSKLRDHRTLGQKYDLFSHSELVGPGLVLWHPKGAMIRYLAERFSQEAHLLNGYDWAYTPHIGKANLWETSGHLKFFKDSMYSPMKIDEDEYYLKPMSCPFHIQIYKNKPKSYRDLPKRYAEYATVYRYELSGVLQGLTRVRGFTQDDAHTFCLPEQAEDEVIHALKFSLYVLKAFGLSDFKAYIATRPEKKSIGEISDWEKAIKTLKNAVQKLGLDFEIDEGGGAFYGPKIDLKVKDSLDREWQLSTVQFDFNLPERFSLEYVGSDGAVHRPIMVHRALFGSAERFLGLLIEHYAGAFPLWLSPTQVVLVPIADRHISYAESVASILKKNGMRVEINKNNQSMNAKVREAEVDKVPFVLVVGDKEAQSGQISVRERDKGNVGAMEVEKFLMMTLEDRMKCVPKVLE